MRRSLPTALLLILPVTSAAAVPGIVHEPIVCVAPGRYAPVEVAAAGASRAELQFRNARGADWYTVAMTAEGGRFRGYLPRPEQTLTGFEYRVVTTGRDLETTETAVLPVRVGDGAAPCAAGAGSLDVPAPIVVKVPAGAPVMPPVPPGFSPAGVVAFEEARRQPWKARSLIAGAVGAGLAGAATLVRKDSDFDPHADELSIEFVGWERGVGRVRPLAFPDLVLAMRVSGGPASPFTLVWNLEWRSPDLGVICVTTGGMVSVPAEPRPSTLTLATPLTASPQCGARFNVDAAHVTVTRATEVVFDGTLMMPYTFQQ